MKARKSLLVTALSIGIAICSLGGTALSAAADPAQSEPPSHDRGLYAEDIGGQVAAPALKVTPHIPPAPVQKAIPRAATTRPTSSSAPASTAKNTNPRKPAKQTPQTAISHGKDSVSEDKQSEPSSGAVQVSHHTTAGAVVVSASLNKAGSKPKYKVGEKLQISVTASKDCNLMVIDFDGHGNLTQIFPNDYQKIGTVKAGESIVIGGPDSPFDYEVAGKGGEEKIFVYAYPIANDNPLTIAWAPEAHSPFRSASMTLEQYRDLVNNSKVFFSRQVKVVPKQGAKLVSAPSDNAANKVELSYVVEAK